MKNPTKAERKFQLISRLRDLGFTYDEAYSLRRIEMTLHRWGEQECGDSNNFRSWAIERDEVTGKPYMGIYPHNGKSFRYPIADREAGALKRCAAIVKARNDRTGNMGKAWANFVKFYHQTDPRGCALYLLTNEQLGNDSIDSVYTRGLAVCA